MMIMPRLLTDSATRRRMRSMSVFSRGRLTCMALTSESMWVCWLRGGTTCCNENYFFPDVQAATYLRHGFRAVVGLPFIEFPSAWAKSRDEYFDKNLAVHDEFMGEALVTTTLAPHAPYTVSDEAFARIRVLSDQLDMPVHIHVHETAHEVEDGKKRPPGQDPKLQVAPPAEFLPPTGSASQPARRPGAPALEPARRMISTVEGRIPAPQSRRARRLRLGSGPLLHNNAIDQARWRGRHHRSRSVQRTFER